jgi:uncharacterized membrane protein
VDRLDAPKGLRTPVIPVRYRNESNDSFGRFTEWIARAMGTPWFIFGLTVFVAFWIGWNTLMPPDLRFDSTKLGLAQNRQDDRDRVQIEQDRQRAERNLADTEYLAREVVALRLAIREMASKDFIRAELRTLLDELDARAAEEEPASVIAGEQAGA